MPFLDGHEGFSPPSGEILDTASASHDDSMTVSDMEIDMEQLEQSKTCAGGCCDHSCGCMCGGCFCQVRTDIQINSNQTTYAGEGGHAVPIVYGELSTGTINDSVVAALGARLASLNTDASASLPIDIAPHGLGPDSLVGTFSFDVLRQRDAHQSDEEHRRVRIQRFGLGINEEDVSDFGNPGEHFPSPQSNNDLIFDFESNEATRVNSNDLPPHTLTRNAPDSSHNPSIAVEGAGRQFDSASIAMRSQYSMETSLCFYPLVVVPECRHG